MEILAGWFPTDVGLRHSGLLQDFGFRMEGWRVESVEGFGPKILTGLPMRSSKIRLHSDVWESGFRIIILRSEKAATAPHLQQNNTGQ